YSLVRVAGLTLGRSGQSVAGGRTILEINSRGQSVWIDRAIERGREAGDVGCRISYDHRRPCRTQRGKGPVGTVISASAVCAYDPEMIRSACTQATDVGRNALRRTARKALVSRVQPIASRGSVLEVHAGGQPARADRTVERG